MKAMQATTGPRLWSARLAAFIGLLAAFHAAGAADPPAVTDPGKRPRIGLVLGGGGAKGAAHIGVIKVLEEMRIPIDCIAGTSMGSIVGAAYATGMQSAELERVITAVDWRGILASAPRQDYPLQRKRLDYAFTLGFEFGVNEGGLTAPSGLVPTHQIEALFRRIVAGAGKMSSFDDLPIPFRAVATDLESGAMVVFDRGDLALAMRASMAVPGGFAPVDYNGRLHVDGMLVRNLPVDVARELCGDVVIAVPVANPAVKRDRLTDLASIAGQAMNIAIEANEKAQLATLTDKDVAIPVILETIGSADFAMVPEAIPIGEAAARKMVAELSRYSLSPQEYAEWRGDLRNFAAGPAGTIDEVRLRGFETTNPEVMGTYVEAKPGDRHDPEKSDADATRLVARGDFSAVSYEYGEEGGRNVLTYNAVEKSWGPNYLMFDLNLATDLKGGTTWGLRVDYEKRWLNSLGGELRTVVQLGRPNFFDMEFYQPLDARQRFFATASIFGNQTLENLFTAYTGDEPLAELDRRRYGIRLGGGVVLDSWGEFRVGLLRGASEIETSTGGPFIPSPGTDSLGATTMRLSFDTLDKAVFPTTGVSGNVTGYFSDRALGAERTYQLASFAVNKVFDYRGGIWTLSLRGGSDFNSGAPFYDQFKMGGLFNLSGLQLNQLVGQEFAFAGLQFRRRFAAINETLGTGFYGGASVEAGNMFRRFDRSDPGGALASGSLFIGIDSRLGPVYLAYGLTEGGRSAVYLYVGSSLEMF
jgi:NTE family protein